MIDRRAFLIVLLFIAGGVCAEPPAIRVAQLPIVISPQATPAVKGTAGELAEYLTKITGGEFKIEVGEGNAGIVVGKAADFTKLPFKVEFAEGPFNREQYLLRSTETGFF